ncbi:MAG: hypothetical protein ABSE00_06505 [Chitinispirillaceae bacterium]
MYLFSDARSFTDCINGSTHASREGIIILLPETITKQQNTILTGLLFTGLTLLLLATPVLSREDSTSLQSSQAALGIDGEALTYIDNIEYNTPQRAGETFFGSSASARFFYRPVPQMLFEAGVYGLRRFGDTQFLSLAMPFIRAQFTSEIMMFTMGSLSTFDAHLLPNLLYRQEYRFDPGLEEGMQLDMYGRHVNWELWAAWDSLDLQNQREHFTAGSATSISFSDFSFPLYLTADHTGGMLYTSEVPVQEHFGGASGVEFNIPVHAGVRAVFGQVLFAGSDYRIRTGNGETGQGDGIFAKVGISPGGFDCSLQLFRGHDLEMPLGDPIFESNIPYYALEISRSYTINNHLQALGGWRFETPDVTTLSEWINWPCYRFWLALRGEFMKGF